WAAGGRRPGRNRGQGITGDREGDSPADRGDREPACRALAREGRGRSPGRARARGDPRDRRVARGHARRAPAPPRAPVRRPTCLTYFPPAHHTLSTPSPPPP